MTGQQLQLPAVVAGTVDPAAGERAKERGMALAAAGTERPWADRCDDAIRLMARRGVPFQASDMVREGLVDEPANHHQWGPRLGAASRRGWITEYATDKSKRSTSKRSRLATWIGTSAGTEVAA